MSLDDLSSRSSRDPSDMLGTALALPDQLREAWRQSASAPAPPLAAPPATLVAVGMGGSAIAADLLAACFRGTLALPLAVVREARLPAYVGPDSLVIATSYSGNTGETLEAAGAALRAGAHLVAITSGGRLAELGGRRGTVLRVRGGLQPRAALAYLLVPMLAAWARWGIVPPADDGLAEAADVLDAVARDAGPTVPAGANPAKDLAERMAGRLPAVYAGSPDVAPAARRWKTQLNENAKTLALWDVFPELTHNEIVGWGLPDELAGRLAAVVLLGGGETADDLRRIRVTWETALRRAADVREVRARGEGPLARLLSLVMLGDLASIYLAYHRRLDPTPVEAIDAVKRGMAAGPEADKGRTGGAS
jgi:glucose/mannose-6-phosphate isomerase